MYKDKTILALITARGGSKGIPRKNIKPLGGKPLLCWTIEAALASKYIDRLILSSDDEEIIEIAKKANCDVPFVRPASLAEDKTGSMEVILHALDQLDKNYDYLLLLQPTSPFRTASQINGIIEDCIDNKREMMVSVAQLKKHPMFMYYTENSHLVPFLKTKDQLRRQDMPAAYEHNGALYLAKTEILRKKKSYNVPEACAYIMSGAANIDIDDLEDWLYAEFLLNSGLIL